MSHNICNGDATVVSLAQAFADLSGTATGAQLPTGVPLQLAMVALTAQSANVSTTPILAVTTSGMFRLTITIRRTQIATTSSTLPSVTIAWTDGDNSAAGSIAAIATNATNTLVATQPIQVLIHAKAGTNITYATASYASSGATPMQYAIRIKCEAL